MLLSPTLFLFNHPHSLFSSVRPFIKHLKFTTKAAAHAAGNSSLQTLSTAQKEQVSLYVDSLLQWNQRMNLTAVTEESEVMTRHVEDSLALIPPLRRAYHSHCSSPSSGDGDDLKLVDVGSGAGLPGIIFAIACPGWKVTLLESMQKRCLFLEHVVGIVGLSNVEIVRERAENAGQCLDFRESFDVAVARAVAEMRVLAEYSLPLVRVGGLFVAAKGFDPREEVRTGEKAIRLMGASVLELCSVQSQGPLGQRTAVICFKDGATPKKYPRHPGLDKIWLALDLVWLWVQMTNQ
ncbi:uncharacterized protein M6B38_354575 [Iris pallida]|uniref:Ribosomal RNA small subunit methyltransferase G n=1 Tax=Iris pallida TaxID=29817 RepID=A0AAX6GPJ5_IRIPA|nr:uncharacterized protein M6B38_354575 [Iris pallida]